MIERIGVQGTMETVPEIECNHDLVYKRVNVVRVEETLDNDGNVLTPAHWKYDETEFTVAEYTAYVREQALLEALDVMEALTSVYEANLEQEELSLFSMEAITSNFEAIVSLEERILQIEEGGTV